MTLNEQLFLVRQMDVDCEKCGGLGIRNGEEDCDCDFCEGTGHKLRTWREVATILGTTTQTLQNWRAGRYEPRMRQMRRLEEVVGDAKG